MVVFLWGVVQIECASPYKTNLNDIHEELNLHATKVTIKTLWRTFGPNKGGWDHEV